jgi:hypothetical protein
MQKEATMLLSKHFEILHPEYVYLQITPHKSTRNYNSVNIAKAIQHCFRSMNKRIKLDCKKYWIFNLPTGKNTYQSHFKISYVVDVQKSNTSFYFIVPKMFLSIIIEKIREIWPQVELNLVEKIESFGAGTTYYQLNTKKEDALSLQLDKKSNEPLNSILAVMEIMQETDRVTLIYNFIPKSQFNWNKRYNDTRKKIEDNGVVIKDTHTFEYKAKAGLSFLNYIFSSILEVFNDFTGGAKEVNSMLAELLITSNILEGNKRISESTNRKRDKIVLDTQILIAANSSDDIRQGNILQSVTSAFHSIDEEGGNELIAKKVKLKPKDKIDFEDYKFKNVGENTFSVDEVQNFIQQPGRQLMRNLGIKHTDVSEIQVPKALQNGYITLGTVKFKGTKTAAYIEDKYDKGSLPLVNVGAQGSGKSTFMANYYRFANIRKEGGVIIDFIKNCEMSAEVIGYLPKEDTIVLDYTKASDIQGFAFNEFQMNDKMDTFEKLSLSNLQAQQILTFVDSINPEQPLQARMRKYLSAAANVVFANGKNSLKEVINCLEKYEDRFCYIDELGPEEKELLSDEIKDLKELDEYSKATKENPTITVTGTIYSRIDGLLDRISLLREDFKLKYMFNKGSKGNIDFADALRKGKTIIVRMPQDTIKKHAKNVITTFLLSKIWIATEINGKLQRQPRPTHISIDEIYQTKTAMKMLANDEILPQTRKFGCKFILSCQYTAQIDLILDTLIGAGASFMLMTGTSEKDFKLFENKLVGFEFEDIKDMEPYSSLNVIYYSGGTAAFISKLPPPLKKLNNK